MPDTALLLSSQDYSLLTDLYQLTMAACYVGEGIAEKRASFELFTRRMPEGFGYIVAMGLAQAIDYLEQFSFTAAQITALQATGIFDHVPDRFWDVLASGGFTGDVWAVPEGTVLFANEPMLRVEAPLWQAQIVETCLLNILNYQSLIATKAARMRDVAGSAGLLEFGTRRAFGPQASLFAARAALAAGFDATSNVLAALQLGQKPSGTMAHALVMALASLEGTEDEAFQAFHRYFPSATLLIDTYDPIAAAQRLAIRVQQENLTLKAVRLDSGDLVSQSQQIRQLLPNTLIVASGDLDEFEIDRLQTAGAQIDSYGIGTKLVTGKPVNGVYKLVEIDGIPVMKASEGKATYPGRKQIFRQFENQQIENQQIENQQIENQQIENQQIENGQTDQGQSKQGQLKGDRLGLITESPQPNEQPLLQPVLKQGQRVSPPEPLKTIADRTLTSLRTLPASVRRIHQPETIAPQISAALLELTEETRRQAGGQGAREQGRRGAGRIKQ